VTSAGRGSAAVGLAVLIAATGLASLGTFSRLAYQDGMTFFGFTFWRAAVGGSLIVLSLWAARLRGLNLPSVRRQPRSAKAGLLAAATIGIVVNLTYFGAFARLPVAITLLVNYTYPAMVAVASTLLFSEPLGRLRAAALILSSAGIMLVVGPGLEGSGGRALDPVGLALATASAIGSALWILVVPAALVGAILPTIILFWGLPRLGGTRTAILMLWEPVAGVLLAAIVLGEGLSLIQVAGGALVIVSAALVQRASREPSSIRRPPADQPSFGETAQSVQTRRRQNH